MEVVVFGYVGEVLRLEIDGGTVLERLLITPEVLLECFGMENVISQIYFIFLAHVSFSPTVLLNTGASSVVSGSAMK